MSQIEKLLLSVLSGTQDTNIKFSDLQKLLLTLHFRERIRGDHFIYTRIGIAEKIKAIKLKKTTQHIKNNPRLGPRIRDPFVHIFQSPIKILS